MRGLEQVQFAPANAKRLAERAILEAAAGWLRAVIEQIFPREKAADARRNRDPQRHRQDSTAELRNTEKVKMARKVEEILEFRSRSEGEPGCVGFRNENAMHPRHSGGQR